MYTHKFIISAIKERANMSSNDIFLHNVKWKFSPFLMVNFSLKNTTNPDSDPAVLLSLSFSNATFLLKTVCPFSELWFFESEY